MSGILQTLFLGAAAAVTDAYFYLVTLLLPGNGTNGAQNNTFLDSSSNNFTITRNGNTTQGTFSPFSQTGWSNYFNGGVNYLSIGSNAVLSFGTGTFTIEFWYFPTNTLTNAGIIDLRASGPSTTGIYIRQGDNSSSSTTINAIVGSTTAGKTGLNLNQWNHIAVVRDGSNNLTVYVNGVGGTSVSLTTNLTDQVARIGGFVDANAAPYFAQGYLSNIRITKGGALYTSTFTPPTSPLTTSVSAGSVSLLTSQSNRFVDNSSNSLTITVSGSPSVQAFSPFAPTAAYSSSVVGGSGYFDGSGDSLNLAAQSAFVFGTGDFTIETWIYVTSLPDFEGIFDFRPTSTNGLYPALFINSGTPYLYYLINNAAVITGTTSIKTNTWYHVALCRSGTSTKLFLNGVQEGSTYSDSNNYICGTSRPIIGSNGFGANSYFYGYMSGFRILKGTAQYTTAFTPPTAPPTAITNTSLLLSFTNAGITDATAKNDLETVGNAQISTTQSKFGGSSMYFDGTGDALLLPSSSLLTIGTGDFTIEAWINPSSQVNSFSTIFGSSSSNGPVLNLRGSGTASSISLNPYGTSDIFNYSYTFTTGTWYHVAVSRAGTSLRIFINGVQLSSTVTNSTNWGAIRVIGGIDSGTSQNYTGYIDDARVTLGYARYTANFTAPTAAFPLQ